VTETPHDHEATRRTTNGQLLGVAVLALAVAAIIVVAFRGSWGALRDAALAAYFDRDAADLYPYAVDGLLIIAIIAAVVLRNDRVARWYCLGIIGGYTAASLAINIMHGLGMFSVDPATGRRPVPPWPVVLLVASLVVASIFLASHLLVYVWRHLFPTGHGEAAAAEALRGATGAYDGATPRSGLPRSNVELARAAFRESLAPGRQRLSQQALASQYGVSVRQARAIQNDVQREQHELAAGLPPAQHTPNGRVTP
jgi:hypothetical protein